MQIILVLLKLLGVFAVVLMMTEIPIDVVMLALVVVAGILVRLVMFVVFVVVMVVVMVVVLRNLRPSVNVVAGSVR